MKRKMADVKNFEDYYLAQARGGSAFPVYQGLMYQRGAGLGNILAKAARFALPIIRQAGRYLGGKAFSATRKVASDVIKGANVKKALKRRFHDAFDEVKQDAQTAGPLGVVKTLFNANKKAKPASRKRRVQRTRRRASDKFPLLSTL